MFYRMELPYDEILDTFVVEDNSGSTVGYTLVHRMYEITDI